MLAHPVNILPLASANYELDLLAEETYTTLNLAVYHACTVSQWCKTQEQRPPSPPPSHPQRPCIVPEYRLGDSTVLKLLDFFLFFRVFCRSPCKPSHGNVPVPLLE